MTVALGPAHDGHLACKRVSGSELAQLMKKTTRITIETERVLTLRGGRQGRIWCERCGAESEIVTLEALGNLVPEGSEKIQQWLDKGELHWSESPQGLVRICLRSLLRLLAAEGTDGASRE
jgi:hypothetical protein